MSKLQTLPLARLTTRAIDAELATILRFLNGPHAGPGATDEERRAIERAKNVAYQAAIQSRRRLAGELGRRMGWPRYEWGERGAQHLFGKRPQWHDMDRMPEADHSGFYSDGRRITALVEHPYLNPDRLPDIYAWAAARGVEVHRPSFPSWWYPGWTELLLITLPGECDL